MWVSAISTGPRGKPLNSSYNNRDMSEYKVCFVVCLISNKDAFRMIWVGRS